MERIQSRVLSHERILTTIVIVALFLFGLRAEADGIESPSSCPRGAEPNGCHWEGYCSPRTCTSDSDCYGDMTCEELDLCLGTASCDSDPRDEGSGFYTVTDVTGLCGDGEECRGECVPTRVCVETWYDDDLNAACSCRAPGRSRSAHMMIAGGLLSIVIVLFRLRRRR